MTAYRRALLRLMARRTVFLAVLPNFARDFDDAEGCAACNFARKWLNLQCGAIAEVIVVTPATPTPGQTTTHKFEARYVQSLDVDGLKYACTGSTSVRRCEKCGGAYCAL